jgi:short-subunit dehydrogenase
LPLRAALRVILSLRKGPSADINVDIKERSPCMNDLNGTRALVTGASSGIGRDMARGLARLGADLIVAARSEEALTALKKETESAFGRDVRVIALDLSKPGAPAELFAKVDAMGLVVDILVNNAGYGIHKYFADTPWEQDDAMIRLLVNNLTHAAKLFVKPMIARGRGYVLNTSSIGAFQPTPTYATYAACKAYVLSFSVALRRELSGTGVSSSALCPGVTYTGFQKRAGHENANFFMRLTGMGSDRVAGIAIRGMLRGKAVIVPGIMNKLSAFMTRLAPRTASASMAASLMGRPEA